MIARISHMKHWPHRHDAAVASPPSREHAVVEAVGASEPAMLAVSLGVTVGVGSLVVTGLGVGGDEIALRASSHIFLLASSIEVALRASDPSAATYGSASGMPDVDCATWTVARGVDGAVERRGPPRSASGGSGGGAAAELSSESVDAAADRASDTVRADRRNGFELDDTEMTDRCDVSGGGVRRMRRTTSSSMSLNCGARVASSATATSGFTTARHASGSSRAAAASAGG